MNWASLRQRRFPREFRIDPSGASALAQQLSAIDRIDKASKVPQASSQEDTAAKKKLATDVGNALWRLRQRMTNPETGQPLDESRKAFRHVETILNALRETGIEIQDHTRSLFRTGLELEVVAFQPTNGLSRDTVIETVRPSIYVNDRVVQVGQVVVGTPAGKPS